MCVLSMFGFIGCIVCQQQCKLVCNLYIGIELSFGDNVSVVMGTGTL